MKIVFSLLRKLGLRDPERQNYPTIGQLVSERIVQRGDIVYDLGAHDGKTAIQYSKLSGETGRVYAFEPVPAFYKKFRERIESITHIGAPIVGYNLGLSSEKKEVEISIPIDRAQMATLATTSEWEDLCKNSEVRAENVQLVALDEFTTEQTMPAPDLMKVDVEGAELYLFQGAQKVLTSSAPLIFLELFTPWQKGFGYGPWEVLSNLSELGYRFLFLCPEGLIEHEPTADEPCPASFRDGCDLLAFQPEKHAAVVDSLSDLRASVGSKFPISSLPMPNLS